jgi:hypothetical protein
LKKTFVIAGVLLVASLLFTCFCWANEKAVSIIINGKVIECDQILSNGRIFLPIRVIAEELGAQVAWEEENNRVVIYNNAGEQYLKGVGFDDKSTSGINNNFITATELVSILDDSCERSGGDLLANGPLILDLRKKEEYESYHIPGAIWLADAENVSSNENIIELRQLLEEHTLTGGKNEIVVYCY